MLADMWHIHLYCWTVNVATADSRGLEIGQYRRFIVRHNHRPKKISHVEVFYKQYNITQEYIGPSKSSA